MRYEYLFIVWLLLYLKLLLQQTKVNKKEIENLAHEKFGNLAGIAQQYLFYWKREA